jgi:hemerythrin superfamily protein
MFEKLNLFKKIIRDNLLLKTELELTKKKVGDPVEVVNKCFKKGLQWYDWNELPIERRRHFFAEAQQFINSDVVNNIKNYLIAMGSQTAFLEQQQDNQKIRDFQMTINGIELLMQEMARIENPDKIKEETDEIYNGI